MGIKNTIQKQMKTLLLILISLNSFSQDSVKAKVLRTAEKTLVFKANGMRFISFDCRCSYKKGDVFYIDRKRWDSLMTEAKFIRRKDY